MMLRFWLVCFVLLFVIVEFWQWLQGLSIALPVCLMAGAGLAIVSNLKVSQPRSRSDDPSLPPKRSDSNQD